jgi:hypothetical protein
MKSSELVSLLLALPDDTEVMMRVFSEGKSGFYAEALNLSSTSVRVMRRLPTTDEEIFWDPRALSRAFSLQPDDVLAIVL